MSNRQFSSEPFTCVIYHIRDGYTTVPRYKQTTQHTGSLDLWDVLFLSIYPFPHQPDVTSVGTKHNNHSLTECREALYSWKSGDKLAPAGATPH